MFGPGIWWIGLTMKRVSTLTGRQAAFQATDSKRVSVGLVCRLALSAPKPTVGGMM